jgi:hypothetical protein
MASVMAIKMKWWRLNKASIIGGQAALSVAA